MFKRIFSKRNRALLAELVRTDFKLRYQGSILGYAWSLLRPLLIFLILICCFCKISKTRQWGTSLSRVSSILELSSGTSFYEMTMQSLTSIVGRGDLIRKIRIPRWIIVLSTSFSALINLCLNLIVVAVFMIFNHVSLMHTAIIVAAIFT